MGEWVERRGDEEPWRAENEAEEGDRLDGVIGRGMPGLRSNDHFVSYMDGADSDIRATYMYPLNRLSPRSPMEMEPFRLDPVV